MVRDVNLALIIAATAMQGTGDKGSVVDTEGGFWATVRMLLGTCTGTTVVCDVHILCSTDGGSNYYHIGQFPKIDESDSDVELARPIYIPRPASGQTVTKVKLATRTSSGTTPVVPCENAFVEPLTSLGAPAVDESLDSGVAKLI